MNPAQTAVLAVFATEPVITRSRLASTINAIVFLLGLGDAQAAAALAQTVQFSLYQNAAALQNALVAH